MTAAFVAWIAAGGDDHTRDSEGERPVVPSRPGTRADLSDATLITRLRNGDERAFESLYHAHARAIASYVMSVTRSVRDAQDIVQEAYLALWRRRATLTPSDHIVGYLYRSARNLALTWSRHETIVARVEEDEHDTPPGIGAQTDAPDARLDHEERQQALAAALARLPERQRLAIHLRFYEEMGYAALGQVLGVSENAAFMLVSRAITALRPVAARFAPGSTPE